MYGCMYVMYVCMYVCMHVCMHVCTHSHFLSFFHLSAYICIYENVAADVKVRAYILRNTSGDALKELELGDASLG